MGGDAALRVALDLVQVPSRAPFIRSRPLPDGVLLLLEIAAGLDEAVDAASELTGRSPHLMRQAAQFFIEQVLLYPGADSYRVLAVGPAAPASELRRNMALLLRALHPDIGANETRALYAGRVTRAWEDLKTPERRSAYDSTRAQDIAAHESAANAEPSRSARGKGRHGQRSSRRSASRAQTASSAPRRRRKRRSLVLRAIRLLLNRIKR